MSQTSVASVDDDLLDDIDSVLAPLLAEEAKEKPQDHDDEFDLLEKELEANIIDNQNSNSHGGSADKPSAAPSSFTHIPRPRAPIVEERQKPFQAVLDEYTSIIPSPVTTYFLNQCGIDNPDEKTKKIISLAVERFISEITNDALHYTKFHAQQKETKSAAPRREGKLILTMEDLALSLKDYGVNLTKPEYFADTPFNTAKDKKAQADKLKADAAKRKAIGVPMSAIGPFSTSGSSSFQPPVSKDQKNPVKKKKIIE